MPAPVDADEVARLLEASRRAHFLYLQHLPRMVPNPATIGGIAAQPGDDGEARHWLGDAATLRAQAERIDPAFSAPAWTSPDETTRFDHRAIMLEYVTALAKWV